RRRDRIRRRVRARARGEPRGDRPEGGLPVEGPAERGPAVQGRVTRRVSTGSTDGGGARPTAVDSTDGGQPQAEGSRGGGAPTPGMPRPTALLGVAVRASQASPERVRRSVSTGPSATRWCGAA